MKTLSGIKALDLTTLLPGPLATLILAEAGADVLKIEPPSGDDMRRFPPLVNGVSALFAQLNRGKRSLALDLKSEAGRDSFKALVGAADVLVEQFRPGVLDRLGFGLSVLSDLNPRLITCSISGYGQSGPKRDVAGHDLNYQAETGLLAVSPGSSSHPTVPPALIADIAGGSYPAVINILLALRHRDQTGQGTHIDIAMADGLFTLAFFGLAELEATGRPPRPGGELLSGGSPRYRLYAAEDGALVAVGAIEEKFWQHFCALIGLPDALRDDSDDPAATIDAVAAIIARQPSAHWAGVFAGEDCCANVVRDLGQAVTDPHFRDRGLFARKVEGAQGEMTALPVPVIDALRGEDAELPAPADLTLIEEPLTGWPDSDGGG